MQDWPILVSLWQHHCDPAYQNDATLIKLWRRQVQALYANHIAHPLALEFLLQERPTLAQFHDWIGAQIAQYQVFEENAEDEGQDHRLSAEQLDFWQSNGYLVLPKLIDAAACAASRAAIWQFLRADEQQPSTWYTAQTLQQGLMLPLYNHPQLNTNRASRRLRAAYEQLYGSSAIYKTIDHASFNPPETAEFQFRGNGLHWDVSLALPMPERYQGLLYLTDCTANDGAFHCVPGFQHRLADWLQARQADEDIRQTAAQTLKPSPVPGQAGDFIIWHQALPHCATPNRGKTPRMVQYVTYIPMGDEVQSVWV